MTWLATRSGRKTLALALTGMVLDGDISRDGAQEVARMVLRDNCREPLLPADDKVNERSGVPAVTQRRSVTLMSVHLRRIGGRSVLAFNRGRNLVQ